MPKSTCSIVGCWRPVKVRALALCQAHYLRHWRGLEVTVPLAIPHGTKTPKERLIEKLRVSPSGCWEWQGSCGKEGYGRLFFNGSMSLAHRVSYELFVGPIPDGAQLDHCCHSDDLTCLGGDRCPHRRCVNPDHLEPVDRLENARRGRAGTVNGQRQRGKTHCKRGHEFTPENTYRDVTGRRHCRECARIRWATYRSRAT